MDGRTGSVSSDPTASGGVIFVVGGDGVVRAFDASGKTDCGGTPTVCTPLWTANVSANGGVAPVVAGGTLFVSSTTLGLVALDPTSSHMVCLADVRHPLVFGAAFSFSPLPTVGS